MNLIRALSPKSLLCGITLLLFAIVPPLASAEILVCDRVREERSLLSRVVAVIDTEKLFLRLSGPQTLIPLITENKIFAYNSPSLEFDRQTECKLSVFTSPGLPRTNVFVCLGGDFKMSATLDFAEDLKSASYSGVIPLSENDRIDFRVDFENCQKQ